MQSPGQERMARARIVCAALDNVQGEALMAHLRERFNSRAPWFTGGIDGQRKTDRAIGQMTVVNYIASLLALGKYGAQSYSEDEIDV